jgi:hypothetical protein
MTTFDESIRRAQETEDRIDAIYVEIAEELEAMRREFGLPGAHPRPVLTLIQGGKS